MLPTFKQIKEKVDISKSNSMFEKNQSERLGTDK